jgi:hypothetical protein
MSETSATPNGSKDRWSRKTIGGWYAEATPPANDPPAAAGIDIDGLQQRRVNQVGGIVVEDAVVLAAAVDADRKCGLFQTVDIDLLRGRDRAADAGPLRLGDDRPRSGSVRARAPAGIV